MIESAPTTPLKPTAAAEQLRPAVRELERIAQRLEAEVQALELRVADAVFILTDDMRKAGHEIRGLRVPIAVMLDELDRLIPVAPVDDKEGSA